MMNESSLSVDLKIIECSLNASRCCLRAQSLAPIRLGQAEAKVDPTVFLQLKQSRITNPTVQATIQDNPSAEAMRGLMFLVVGYSSLRLLDGSISTSRGESHYDWVAEPGERRLNVIRLKGTQNESSSLNCGSHRPVARLINAASPSSPRS